MKFRQLNKDNGQFHYWGMVDGKWVQPLLQENYVHPKDSDRFSGLSDKNGKEIYGSDFVELCDYYIDGYHFIKSGVNVVQHEDVRGFGLYRNVGIGTRGNYICTLREAVADYDAKVVGNIY